MTLCVSSKFGSNYVDLKSIVETSIAKPASQKRHCRNVPFRCSRPSLCRTLAYFRLASNNSSDKSSCLLVHTCLRNNTGPGRISQAARDSTWETCDKNRRIIQEALCYWQCTTMIAWQAKHRATQFPNIPQANRAILNTTLSFSTNAIITLDLGLGRYHADDKVWSDSSPHLAAACNL